MAQPIDATLPATTKRARRSLGSHADIRKGTDKENATVDLGSTISKSRKSSRSKSIGPGGLDALKQGSGNRRASLAAPVKAPRSILKPAPLPEIPPLKQGNKRKQSDRDHEPTASATTSLHDDSLGSKIAVKSEEEQQAAARERDEKDRRDARRKSLANRRVSFAAEATLHTFHDLDFMQDATASTDASRRASAAANKASSNSNSHGSSGRSTDDTEEQTSQRRRRSSVVQPMNIHDPADDTGMTAYSSDSEPPDEIHELAEEEEEEADSSNSESDDEGTMMSLATDVTGTTIASERTVDSTEDSSTLNAALRLAARQAGTQQRGQSPQEEDSDEGEEIIPSFGWVKKDNAQSHSQAQVQPTSHSSMDQQHPEAAAENATETNLDMDMDMEVTAAVGGILKKQPLEREEADEEIDEAGDMSMDVTRAFGGIVQTSRMADPLPALIKGLEDDEFEEVTMELTTAIGGIHRQQNHLNEQDGDEDQEAEDMSMELTTVMGGVLASSKSGAMAASLNDGQVNTDDATMDMTMGLGRIVRPANAPDLENGNSNGVTVDMDMDMDMTAAVGGILQPGTSQYILNKLIMEEETSFPDDPQQAIAAVVAPSSPIAREPIEPQMRSPGRQSQPRDRSRSPEKSSSQTKKSLSSERKLPGTPEPLISFSTPTREIPTTPGSRTKTPRQSSPMKTGASGKSSEAPMQRRIPQKNSDFREDLQTGNRTPTVVSTPQRRRLSGMGIDRDGMGSPRVAAICDRRGSIGDSAAAFIPGKRAVAFEDPKALAKEIDRERELEDNEENQRKILQQEADGNQDGTVNLRDMIDSMSPKRIPLRGRKSLHVGSASGLLGKRPAELDDEQDDDEQRDGVKRLKGHQGSPVKNIRLGNPPSKEETTGRALRLSQKSKPTLSTPTIQSSPFKEVFTTPKNHGRFKDVPDSSPRVLDLHKTLDEDESQLEDEADDERIQLQDFLNMTSIRFMELNTTKRRHTVAPGSFMDGILGEGVDDVSLERCVVAGSCTVPTLELYQHSCRELKKYISEGRRMVREIETDTFEENPPLFREYLSAKPEVKALMDHQFKNVKTHARLLSKAMWYEWRMKLQDGLREGLLKIGEGMDRDEETIHKQRDLISTVLPQLTSKHEALREEHDNLEKNEQELALCDPVALQHAREELADLNEDIQRKKKLVEELRQQYVVSEQEVVVLGSQKQQCLIDIQEAEKVREECRGWTSSEVSTLKARVEDIERKHGWAITGLSGTALSMTFKREIELVFDMASFQPGQANSRIDLWYIADMRETAPQPKTAEKEFLLDCIRDHIRALPQSSTAVSKMLNEIGNAWAMASLLSSQLQHIGLTFPTKMVKTSDTSVKFTMSLLMIPLESKVEASLGLHARSGPNGLELVIVPEAKVIYGEHFNVAKIQDYLTTRMGEVVGEKDESWSEIMVELHGRLIARGRK